MLWLLDVFGTCTLRVVEACESPWFREDALSTPIRAALMVKTLGPALISGRVFAASRNRLTQRFVSNSWALACAGRAGNGGCTKVCGRQASHDVGQAMEVCSCIRSQQYWRHWPTTSFSFRHLSFRKWFRYGSIRTETASKPRALHLCRKERVHAYTHVCTHM